MYLLVCRPPSTEAADREAQEDESFCGVAIDWDSTGTEWGIPGALNTATGARDTLAAADNREDLEPYLAAAKAAGWDARIDHAAVVAHYVNGEGCWRALARLDEGTIQCWDQAGVVRLPPYDTLQDLIALLDEAGAL